MFSVADVSLKNEGYFFEEFKIGDSAAFERRISEEDVGSFAKVTGDWNPIHFDDSYARDMGFPEGKIIPGMLIGSMVATLIGTIFPGYGSILGEIRRMKLRKTVPVGALLRAEVTVKGKRAIESSGNKGLVVFECRCFHDGEEVLVGEATVFVPRKMFS